MDIRLHVFDSKHIGRAGLASNIGLLKGCSTDFLYGNMHFMKTKITELLDIQHPILMTGMSWISEPELVAAVSEAGGLGILATGPLKPSETREKIRQIRSLTSKPFGAGATLLMPGARENAQVMLEENIPVINFSLGKGDWIVDQAHQYGGKVIATVTNERHAQAAESYGCDAVLATGNAAAAHGSPISTIVLVPAIARAVSIPVIATGGICDGKGLVAALALGAEAIAMGTRFSLTRESPVHPLTNQMVLQKSIEETIYTDRFDSIRCRVMETDASVESVHKGPRFFKGLKASIDIARSLDQSWMKLALGSLLPSSGYPQTKKTDDKQVVTPLKKNGKKKKSPIGPVIDGVKEGYKLMHMAKAYMEIKAATTEGDLEKGVHLIGQVQGLINDLPTVEKLITRIISEADDAYNNLGRRFT